MKKTVLHDHHVQKAEVQLCWQSDTRLQGFFVLFCFFKYTSACEAVNKQTADSLGF